MKIFLILTLVISFFNFGNFSEGEEKINPKIFLDIARYHMILSEYEKAINSYENYLKDIPDDETVAVEYIHSLFWLGKIQEGISGIEKLILNKGRKTDLLLEYATILAFSERYDRAIDIYKEILVKEPNNLSAHLGLSFIYFKTSSEKPSDKKLRERIKSIRIKFKFELQNDIEKAKSMSERLKYSPPETGLTQDQIKLKLAYTKREIGSFDESAYYFREYLKIINDPNIIFELAKTLSYEKKYNEAIAELNIILKDNGKDARALKELALYQSWNGDYKEAIKNFQTLLANDPENLELKADLALSYEWSGQNKKGAKLFEEILAKDPNNKEAKIGIIETADLETLLKIHGENPSKESLITIHKKYVVKKSYDQDIDLLSKYLTENHQNDLLVLSELGKTYTYKGEIDKAIEINERILSLDDGNIYAIESLPNLYLWSGNYPKSKDAFLKLDSKRPLTSEERLHYAEALKNLGEREKALKYFRASFKESAKNKAAIMGLIELGDITVLNELFEKDPKNREITEKLSSHHISQGKLKEAEIILKKHLKYDPNDSDSILNMARVLSWEGKYQDSIVKYDLLLNSKKVKSKKSLFNESGNVALWWGKTDIAKERFDSVLKEDPSNLDALTGLSKIYLWLGDKVKEKESYKTILSLNRGNDYANKMLEKAENDPSYKVNDLEEKLSKNPDDFSTIEELVPLYEKLEAYDKALLYNNMLLEKNPDGTLLRERNARLKDKSSQKILSTITNLREESLKNPFAKRPKEELISYLIANGKNEEALNEMQRYALYYPEDQKMRKRLADTLSWEARYTESQKEYESLLLKNPADINYKLSLARVLSWGDPHNHPLAVKLANDIIKSDPGNIDAYLIRGNIYRWSMNFNRALKDYRKVLTFDSNNKEAQDGIDAIIKYGPDYFIDLKFLFKGDNSSFKLIEPSIKLGMFWNRYLSTNFQYAHPLYSKSGNPDINEDQFKITQGIRLGDPLYLEGYVGFNKYHDIDSTADFGASIAYFFAWRDSLTLGFENADIVSDAFTYESLSPQIIEADYLNFNLNFNPTRKINIDTGSRFGFYSDTNRMISANTVFSYMLNVRPFVTLRGAVRFLRLAHKLYPASRYWDPPWYISFVPGVYMEFDLSKSVVYFADLSIGYGNEDGNSALEFGAASGFIFKATDVFSVKLEGFYFQTGRSLGNHNYYLYGGRGLFSFNF